MVGPGRQDNSAAEMNSLICVGHRRQRIKTAASLMIGPSLQAAAVAESTSEGASNKLQFAFGSANVEFAGRLPICFGNFQL